jgi:Legionella pneumophila major outer membrane protein precursor
MTLPRNIEGAEQFEAQTHREKERTMNKSTKLAILLSLALTAAVSRPASAATIEEQISERLNSVERENAELKQRLKLIESSVAKSGHTLPRAASRQNPPQAADLYAPGQRSRSETLDSATAALASSRTPQVYKSPVIGTSNQPHHFEVSGSLLYLQPGADDLEYATLVSPLPLPTPNWANQSLSPKFSPAFRFGLRYIPVDANDLELNWTHLNTSASASVFGAPGQMVGPPFEIGPTASVYQNGHGNVSFSYDSVNVDAGYTFCADCAFQLRVFGGAEFARINQDLTGTFQSTDGLTSASNTTNSLFAGGGPRLGMKGLYAMGNFQFFGEMAGAGLIGTAQSSINFSATSTILPGLAQPNNQSLTSPDKTQVVPGFDARLGTAYTFPPGNFGQLKIEVGYQATVFMNAVNHYALTQVSIPPAPASVGVFLATAQHLQSNFTTQGPYLTAGWSF